MITVTSLLNELSELQSAVDVINLRFDDLRKDILTPEIQEQLDDVEVERATATDTAQEGISKLQTRIKEYVLDHGASVKADYLHAIYAKGRVSWNTKGLAGYAVAHPEIEAFKKVGKPSVSIRRVK